MKRTKATSINKQHGAKGAFPQNEIGGIKVLATTLYVLQGGGYFGLALVWSRTECQLAVEVPKVHSCSASLCPVLHKSSLPVPRLLNNANQSRVNQDN